MTVAYVLLRQSPFSVVQQYFLTHGCHLQPGTAAPEREIIIDLTFGQLSVLDCSIASSAQSVRVADKVVGQDQGKSYHCKNSQRSFHKTCMRSRATSN